MPHGEEMMKQILNDCIIFDATQVKLPKNVRVPNVGWNSVLDGLRRKLPYPEPEFSWSYNMRREYGIPKSRQK